MRGHLLLTLSLAVLAACGENASDGPLKIYPTEEEAVRSGECGKMKEGGDILVLPYGDEGFTCEVHYGDPPT